MILGVGIDAVEVARFAHWQNKSDEQLKRIFSDEEIVYCRSVSAKSAERFAARFAAREALLKALSAMFPNLSLLQVSRACKIGGIPPKIDIDWTILNINRDGLTVYLSLSHTQTDAYAIVIIEHF
ncbi:MAG: 4'-phosphopantetheinyl transferase superfamily protein [Candidatus Dependentiae bacterium]|nr:4'-phosphopantetheinyl transferase superfamily protein [Candidatus Dependentiae bacterium]